MTLSRESKILCGLLLLAIPTIMFGGVTMLGILMDGAAGHKPGSMELSDTQVALWRAGHAHAGVIASLALILQPLVDNTAFSNGVKWIARLGAPIASVIIPAGFFGMAFIVDFKYFIYTGIALLGASLILTGVGLLKNLQAN